MLFFYRAASRILKPLRHHTNFWSPPHSSGSTRCQNVVFQVVTSVRPEINYLASLVDSAPSKGSSQQVLNLLSMPDRSFMVRSSHACH